MLGRHEEEINQFLKELEESLPVKPKDTAELLNLKRMEE